MYRLLLYFMSHDDRRAILRAKTLRITKNLISLAGHCIGLSIKSATERTLQISQVFLLL